MSDNQVTKLLIEWGNGDRQALDELIPLVERELKRIASNRMKAERAGHLLQTTALVNEAYVKLVGQNRAEWSNRAQFFAVCARLMRNILIDYAREARADKRGGGVPPVTLPDDVPEQARGVDLIDLDNAMLDLAEIEPRQAEVLELRFWGGLKIDEIAAIIGRAPSTVKRDLARGKAFIEERLDLSAAH